MVNVGVIGCGHWGPNHIRIFNQLPNACSVICSDLDKSRLQAMKNSFPDIEVTLNSQEIFQAKTIDAVCISAPTNLHYSLTKTALEYGKHVLCEKPLALKPEECEELIDLSRKKKKILMVGHVFVFNPGIVWLKNYLAAGELGKVYYAYSTRTNLGPFRYDVNALWDLAPHDISIFNYLLGTGPINVSARGQRCLGGTLEDLAFATLEYPENVSVNLHVSWLDPRKVRQITIVGDKKMVLWDDLDSVGPIRLYDKHVEKTSIFYETYGEFQLLSREGSITIPKIPFGEPLKAQGQYFIDCVEQNKPPELADASKGADVVKALCAIQESMNQNGSLVDIV